MKKLLNVSAVIGFLIVLGVVGAGDYSTEANVYYPVSIYMKHLLLGVVFIMPYVIRRIVEWLEIR